MYHNYIHVVLLTRLTVDDGLHIECTKSTASTVQDRTVSVLPSRYKRVIEASYVRENSFTS